MMRTTVLILCLSIPSVGFAQPAAKRPMQVEDLFRFKRLSDPQISPDGKHVVYVQTTVDLGGNRPSASLWLAPTDKGESKPLTKTDKRDSHPRWSPDGRYILFVSNRSGSSQLWIVSTEGGEPRQLTTISTDANTGIWSRDGKMIAFVSAVWPEFSEKPFAESDALNKKRIDEREKSPVKAKVFTRLFFRHWDEYVEDKRQHLFVLDVENGPHGPQPVGLPRDVTPGDRDAYPTSMTFSVGDDFTFSPDGKHLVFTAVPAKNEAWSTNHDICRVPSSGGAKTWEALTKNPAAEGAPQFSPDGKWLAYRAQKRPGFEADRWELMIVDAGGTTKAKSITADFDSSIDEFVWDPRSDAIHFVAEEKGTTAIYQIAVGAGNLRRIEEGRSHSGVSISHNRRLAFLVAALDHPGEVFMRDAYPLPQESPRSLDQHTKRNRSEANARLLSELDLARPESVNVQGAGGTPMQMWILKPPGFDTNKKWPLVFLVHGGPQGAWTDSWSYRWNPQVWAAQGYVVALPNPRGSTGFGQKYVDEISGDWGGKVYEDLMAGLAYLEKQPYIDSQRMAAAGASYGGYMMNWFAVNTGKFKTLISHCGVWNFDSMYATTEELWFDEWEHGGPPWGKNRHSYEKHSPHRFAANLAKFKTPMLIIHNDLDFRVPISEGIQVFTTLQRLGVPSRMINFPDEGHWVLRPANSKYWHEEVFGWLKKHVLPGGK